MPQIDIPLQKLYPTDPREAIRKSDQKKNRSTPTALKPPRKDQKKSRLKSKKNLQTLKSGITPDF